MQLNKISCALAIAGLASAFSPAFAAEGNETQKVEKITITGSNIKATAKETAVPLQVIGRKDIEATGAQTLQQLLTTISTVSSSLNSLNSSSGSFAAGGSGIEMRNLGKASTLVLVNGRRIAPFGLADGAQEMFTNTNAIAVGAIERVEILKFGASAIYGSDAVAGVINIITRKNYQGAEGSLTHRQSTEFSGAKQDNATLTFGLGDYDAKGVESYLSLEYTQNPNYTQADVKSRYPEWHRGVPGNATWDAPSINAYPGNFLVGNSYVAAKGCNPALINKDGQCTFDLLPYTDIVRENKAVSAFSNTHFKLPAGLEGSLELSYSKTKSNYNVAPMTAGSTTSLNTWYNAVERKVMTWAFPKLPANNPYNTYGKDIELRYRYTDNPDFFYQKADADQYRAMFTVNGTFGAFDWESAVGYMASHADKASNTNIHAVGYTNAIVSGTYKFGQVNSDAVLSKMFATRHTIGDSKTAFVDAKVSGQVAELPAGPVMIAAGADFRHESYSMASSDNVIRAELVGIGGLQVDDSRNNAAAFIETDVPVIRGLDANFAVRADKTGSFDTHLSPKIGLRYQPMDTLMFRATLADGFRAPNILESGKGLGRTSFATNTSDPKRCDLSTKLYNYLTAQAKGVVATQDMTDVQTQYNNDCKGGVGNFVKGNPDLQPEVTRSQSLGVVFSPTSRFSVALDYYGIERHDEINTPDIADVLALEGKPQASTIQRIDSTANDARIATIAQKYGFGTPLVYAAGSIGAINQSWGNSGKTKTSGLDLDIKHRFDIAGVGRVRVGLDANYLLSYKTFNTATNNWGADRGGDYLIPRFNATLTGSLTRGVWTNTLIAYHTGGYSQNDLQNPTWCKSKSISEDKCGVGSDTTYDWALSYRGVKNLTVDFMLKNLTNKEAPVDFRGGYSITHWRIAQLGLDYKFF
ncbi:TonB-dependent receptor [Burkholderiaceae bacterium DAT-1]|nr:TonB-dependent receptor [Burkholderiaceae bacterium DAT-1]